MKFSNPSEVEQITWTMRLADYPRGLNRSRIDDLANGVPPYTDDEVAQNNIATNVNYLELTKITHDARRQFANAFLVPNPIFTVDLDYGPVFKRREWSSRITKEINRIIKKSQAYFETERSVFASVVNHGIGPSGFDNRGGWIPEAFGIEDVLVPSNTKLSMKNLPFFAIFKQFTAQEFMRMTRKERVDKAWNMDLVNKVVGWIDEQARQLMASSWPEVWSPEKMGDRIKGDGGLYASDAVPTIDCFDFYYWDDDGKQAGWRRRMILDAWGDPGAGGIVQSMDTSATAASRSKYAFANGFLYNSGNRVYADNLSEIINWQFGDVSARAPFRYHSARGLGFLLFAVCHLQNRLRCKFNDATFESLLQYFRVANPSDMDRLTKVDLIDKGILPEGLQFVPPDQRWQINEKVVGDCMKLNRQTMADNSASFTQDFDFGRENEQETATLTMAKINSTAALVGSMLNQAYTYQGFQYSEICRRFCMPNSKCPDVREFRVNVLKSGVPEEALNVSAWNIQPVRVIGHGNKMLEIAVADKLMAIRPSLDPDAQQEVSRIFIAAHSNDYDLARRLVPESPTVSNSIHDAEQSVGTLMLGIPMSLKQGVNHQEYAETLLRSMASIIHSIMINGAMATPKEIVGLQALAGQTVEGQPLPGNGITQHISILAEDKAMKSTVKILADQLKNLMNEVKGFAQRLQQQQQAQQGGNGAPDPKDVAKAQAMIMQAETKAKLTAESHAQRTAQRQIQFEQKMKQDQMQHELEVEKSLREHEANLAKTGIETAHDIQLRNMEPPSEK